MKKLLAICLLATFAMACTSMPVTNIEERSVPMEMKISEVSKRIKEAAIARRWSVVSDEKNEIILDIHVRSHYLKVKVPYTAKRYSIVFMESKNLGHKPGGNSYHKKTFGWMKKLNWTIQKWFRK